MEPHPPAAPHLQAGNVGAVVQLGHREAAGRPESVNVIKELAAVALGAQVHDAAAPERVLHAHLDRLHTKNEEECRRAGERAPDGWAGKRARLVPPAGAARLASGAAILWVMNELLHRSALRCGLSHAVLLTSDRSTRDSSSAR